MIVTQPVSLLAFFAFIFLNISFPCFTWSHTRNWIPVGHATAACWCPGSLAAPLAVLASEGEARGMCWESWILHPSQQTFERVLYASDFDTFFKIIFFWVLTTYFIWGGVEWGAGRAGIRSKIWTNDVGKTSGPCVCDSGNCLIPTDYLPLWVC